MKPIQTRGFELRPWQQSAVEAWEHGWRGRPNHGTLEVVTGGGKTLIALECAARVAQAVPDLKLAVVVPTEALARQWRDAIARSTTVPATQVGLLGAGGRSSFKAKQVVVAVLNTAAERLPELARDAQPLMLVVDECHRAGAPSFSKVLHTPSHYRLGLSATPDREEFDDDGEPLAFDEQAVGRALGGVVFRFSLRDARLSGWLPEYSLHHHGVALSDSDRLRYDAVSRKVDDAADTLRGLGIEPARARSVSGRGDDVGDAARAWVRLTAERKDLLYRAPERHRVVVELIRRELQQRSTPPRAILFHERVDEAVVLHEALVAAFPAVRVELEHSRLPNRRRLDALAAFRQGDASLLVSVKSLVEGIDVPEADVGVSVASSSSVRQRVQSLGRVLRRDTGAADPKSSTMHLLYVSDSVDELIYGKADWSDLTGEKANHYWLWPTGSDEPVEAPGPPLSPLPTEEQAWEQIGGLVPDEPVLWPGVVSGQEYTVSTTGVVHNAFDRLIENPQDVGEMVDSVRGRPGGRFRVTPEYRLILVWSSERGSRPFVAGRLGETFRVAEDLEDEDLDVTALPPGSEYRGASDKSGGSYRLSQRSGGVIERRVAGGKESALIEGTGRPDAEANARAVMEAWEGIERVISRFFVNSQGHAWYEERGGRRFLAEVRGGFVWPSEIDKGKQ